MSFISVCSLKMDTQDINQQQQTLKMKVLGIPDKQNIILYWVSQHIQSETSETLNLTETMTLQHV